VPLNTTKNYSDQSGNRFVIGGELAVQGDGKITKDGETINLGAATTDTAGMVKQAAHIDAATATPEQIVTALIAAGVISGS
jgi:hypothetical protein